MKLNASAPGFRQRFTLSIAAAILLTTNLLIFTPFIIYNFNRDEFNFSFSAILINVYAPVLVLGVVILTAIGLILRGRYHSRFVVFVFALGVLTWLQSTFILWNLGQLAGIKIVWENFFWQGVIDGGIWVAALILALIFYRRVVRVVVVISFVLVFGQLGHAVFLTLIKSEKHFDRSKVTRLAAPESFYEFSKEKNVIVVLFDAFQSAIFEEIIEAEPRFRAELDGFVFFKETTGLFPFTEFSIPTFFSGKPYQLDMPFEDYIRTSMNEETISTAFLDEGYEVDIAPLKVKYCGPHTNCFLLPVPYGGSSKEVERVAAAYLMDLSIFRAVPLFLKNFLVYRDQQWQFLRIASPQAAGDEQFGSLEFLADMTQGARMKEKRPTFKYLHLFTTHLPYVITKDCRPAGKVLKSNRANAINVSRCSLEGFISFLKKLKSIGVYDNSLIVLMSDHGTFWPPKSLHGENPELLSTHKNIKTIASLAMPLLVIKPPHEAAPFKVSNAQTMLLDLPATLTSLMGTKKFSGNGRPVFSIDPLETRSRKFYNYRPCRDCTIDGYFVPFEEFDIRGSLFDLASWKYAGLKHATNDTTKPPERVEFRPGGAMNYLFRNWHKKYEKHKEIGEWGRWAIGDSATMLLTLPKEKDAQLKVRLYAPEYNQPQRVTLRVNGKVIGAWDTPYVGEKYADYTLLIKKDADRKPASLIEFEFAKKWVDDSGSSKKKNRTIFFGSVSVSPLQR